MIYIVLFVGSFRSVTLQYVVFTELNIDFFIVFEILLRSYIKLQKHLSSFRIDIICTIYVELRMP